MVAVLMLHKAEVLVALFRACFFLLSYRHSGKLLAILATDFPVRLCCTDVSTVFDPLVHILLRALQNQ
jgi:hypothetical protein